MAYKFILSVIGYTLIWFACDVKRTEESKVKIFSKWWWIQCALIFLGALIINDSY